MRRIETPTALHRPSTLLPFPTVSLEYPTTIECHHLLHHYALLPPPPCLLCPPRHHALLPQPPCLLCHPRPLRPPSPLHYLLPAMLLHTTGHTALQAVPFLVHLRRPSTRPSSWLFPTNSSLTPLPTLSNAPFPTTCSTLLLPPPLHHHHHHLPPLPPLHFLLQSSLCHPPLLYTSLPWILMHIGSLAPPLLSPRLPPQPLSYPKMLPTIKTLTAVTAATVCAAWQAGRTSWAT